MKRWIAIWIAASLTGVLTEAQDPYLEGIARLGEGDLTSAVSLFGRALENNGSNPDILLKIADAHYRAGDFRLAIEYATRADSLDPGKGNYLLARSFAGRGNAEKAVSYLRKHLESADKLPRPEIILDKAFSGIEESQAWKALWKQTWYSEAEDIESEVTYLRRSGEYVAALEKIDESLKSNERWDNLYAEKGRALDLMGNHQNAVSAFSRAIEISPGIASYYLGRARAYEALGKFTEGIRDMEHALRLEPEMIGLYKEISLLCRDAGNYRKATESILQYLLYYPSDAEAHYICGNVYYESGQYLKALAAFNRCLDLDTGKAEYFIARGNIYLNGKTWSYAIKDFSMALDLDPFNPETWYLKGLCRLNMQDPEGARSDLENAVRYGSKNARELLEDISLKQ